MFATHLPPRISPGKIDRDWAVGRKITQTEMQVRAAFPGMAVSAVNLRYQYATPGKMNSCGGADRGSSRRVIRRTSVSGCL